MPSVMENEEESVYNLIPRPEMTLQKPPMHKSKFAATADVPTFSGAVPHRAAATMGRANGMNADPPSMFLHKHSKEPVLPDPAPPSVHKFKLKAPVPLRTEVPTMGLMSDKDWVVANAVDAIASKPPARTKGATAASLGGKQTDMNYTQRPGFGKVPVYLKRNKAAIADEQQQIETFMRMRTMQEEGGDDSAQPMSPEERGELLSHLKSKWAQVNAAYLKLGFVLDIESKIKRKEALEAELAQIEADIKLLQRGNVILIVRD